ncbi:uncharacterized protein, partial [Temnothorax nylanderi]|uniref:uncharacterized protein n=1 Tax=Temnothorax nylanderi TaxID=102681 RepID=UPI003A845C5C
FSLVRVLLGLRETRTLPSQRALLSSAENNVNFTLDSAVTLKAESVGNASRCILETNRGEKLEYMPRYQIRDDIESIDDKTCSIRINKANDSHAGAWKVTAYIVKKSEKNEEDVDLLNDDISPKVFLYKLYNQNRTPFRYIDVYDGQYVYAKHLENYENLMACYLTGPKMKTINLLTEKRNDFELFGQCGVSMKVNTTYQGWWKLDALVNNNYMSYDMEFRVFVRQLAKEDPNELVIQWTRGSPGIISLSSAPLSKKVCQIVDPYGNVIVPISKITDECYHEVKVATAAHEGVWRARYNVYGMLEPVEQKFRVETVDRVIFNTSVTRTEDGSTTLLCRLEMKDADPLSLSFNFVRPDGMILFISPGIGTERYISMVDKRFRADYQILECSITIRKLEDVDYGAWRCEKSLSYPYDACSYGSVLHVDYPDSRGNNSAKGGTVKTRADDVYVKRGDPFTIKCVADSVLKYCWLRSPNGTSYSITQNPQAVSPFVLHYHGNGLTLGECGAKISASVDSDNGQWSCLMGETDAGEITAAALVTVTETYLVAEQTEIAVSPRNDPVLSCHILPRMLDRTVHYCRWIRPDGYGIHNDISHRYTTSSSYSECRLVILDYRPKEDYGNWTCVAGLAGENGYVEEAWDQLWVNHPRAQSLSLAVSSS